MKKHLKCNTKKCEFNFVVLCGLPHLRPPPRDQTISNKLDTPGGGGGGKYPLKPHKCSETGGGEGKGKFKCTPFL